MDAQFIESTVDRGSLPSEAERSMLRDSVRGYLEQQWPVAHAAALAQRPEEVARLWQGLADQGLASLGSKPSEGGLHEILVVMEELGRAACPAPMLGAAIANLALRGETSAAMRELLTALHGGRAAMAVGFGSHDGDPNAGAVWLQDGVLNGTLAFVEGADNATHLLAMAEGPVLAVVAKAAEGVKVTYTPGLSVPPLARVEFADVKAMTVVALTAEYVRDLNRVARLALVARSLGAAQRGFELVVAYTKERHQFGQPIGKFQAIQHKLANCLMALEGVRQTLGNAATDHDHEADDWRLFASACYAHASPALRQVSLETHHVFGAIGYSEEHEAPRHFRRIHGDLARHGGPRRAREEVAAYVLDEGKELPDYDLSPAGNAFRQEVREWLAEHWSSARETAHRQLPFANRRRDPKFSQELGKQGWLGISWPKEFGGQARTPFEQLAYIEELELAEAPEFGLSLQAPALMKFGSKAQQDQYLPAILRGDITFSLGYSEPSSGSDLASLRTLAVRDGDEWVINGQKIWNSAGSYADYIWLAARTDPDAQPRHAGISVFIVPAKAPGVTLQPSMALYGRTFCNVFLDDVRVPADALVGEVNGGWQILTGALADERMLMGASVHRTRRLFSRVSEYVRRAEVDGKPMASLSWVRDRIGALAAEIEVGRRLLMHCVAIAEQGRIPIHEAAMSKCYSGELMERFGEAALDLIGMQATLSEDADTALAAGEIEQYLRQSIMFVIGGGTVEIQRNLIAQRGLGLPR